eukprot:UN00213
MIGALVLGNSLKVNSNASRVIMVSSNVSEEHKKLLETVYDNVIVVPVLDVTLVGAPKRDTEDPLAQYYNFAFTKFYSLNLVQFDKIALLDSDMIVFAHCDDIFACQTPAVHCPSVKNTQHNKAIEDKIINKVFKDANAISGCTLLLKPSTFDFSRIIKQLATKLVKQQQVIQEKKPQSIKQMAKKSSAFSLLDLDDDEEDDEEEQEPEPQQKDKKAKFLTKEELETTLFGDEKVKQKIYPFDVFSDEKEAPFGLSYEGKKSSMEFDTKFILTFYQKSFKQLASPYALPSWHVSKLKSGQQPVIMHFTKKVWELSEEAATEWLDIVFWYIACVQLYKSVDNKEIKAFIEAKFPLITKKVEEFDQGLLAYVPAETAEKAQQQEVILPENTPVDNKATQSNAKTAAAPKKVAWQ